MTGAINHVAVAGGRGAKGILEVIPLRPIKSKAASGSSVFFLGFN